MKFKTVREGQQAVVFNHLGEGRLVVGPERLFLFRERIQFLKSYTAAPDQYLVITYNAGKIVHEPGPCEVFQNPMQHSKIHIAEGKQLDANHVLVVYNKTKAGGVERRVVQGPTLFIPTAEEWLHKFEWHGEDQNEIGRMIPKQRKFIELACIPDQFNYTVRDVRTNDDTTLQVQLMIFYHLKDIITMLEATHDPIADMINAVCADVIAFAGKLSFAEFLQNSSSLSDLKNYTALMQRSQQIGYDILKVVYRGYSASPQLQAMQDQAIQSRTKLRLNAELEEQRQKLTDFRLTKEQERTERKNQMEKDKADHSHKVATLKQQHVLQTQERKNDVDLEIERLEQDTKRDCEKSRKQHLSDYLGCLQGLGVDLTQYLINRNGASVDKEYRVVTAGGSAGGSVCKPQSAVVVSAL